MDVTPVGGLAVTGVEAITSGEGTAYTGTVVNDLAATLNDPSVTVFPVNRVGRPLGMATASTTLALPPGGTWTFQTDAVDDPGVDQVAYADRDASLGGRRRKATVSEASNRVTWPDDVAAEGALTRRRR